MITDTYYFKKLMQSRHWIHSTGIQYSEQLTGSRVDSAFHSSESNNMCTKSGWGFVAKVLEKVETSPLEIIYFSRGKIMK